jgi:hypothetical protein
MPIKIKQAHGGVIINSLPGESGNPNGRPKSPRKLKEFIKDLENEDDELLLPFDAVEVVEKNGQTFYKLKNSKGGKMFITAYNRAIKGDAKWADFLVKMGFAGGYEPTKNANQFLDKNGNPTNPEKKITIEVINPNTPDGDQNSNQYSL